MSATSESPSTFDLRARQMGLLTKSEKSEDVIRDDAEYLASVNIPPEQIAGILENYIYKAIYNGWDIGSRFATKEKTSDEHEKPECPCGDPKHRPNSGSTRFTIKRRRDNQILTYYSYMFNIIRAHGFFGGHGILRRIEPRVVVEFFEMEPGVDYTLKYSLQRNWKRNFSGSHFDKNAQASLRVIPELALKSYSFPNGIQAFLFPNSMGEFCGRYRPNPDIKDREERWIDFYQFMIKDFTHKTPDEESRDIGRAIKITEYYRLTGKCRDGMYLNIFNPNRVEYRLGFPDLGVVIASDINVDATVTYVLLTEKIYTFDPAVFP